MSLRTPEESLRLAASHHAAGRLPDALAACEWVLAAQPQNINALHLKGLVLTKLNRPAEALEILSRAIQMAPAATQLRNNYANALRVAGQLENALREFQIVISQDANFSRAHLGKAQTLSRLGRTEESIEAFRAAIQLQPDLAEAHTGLGIELSTLGRKTEAIESMRQVVAIVPNSAAAHYNLGNAFLALERLDEAEASFRKAIELSPNTAPAHQNLASVLAESGRVDEALALNRRAVELAPKDPNIGASLLMNLHYQSDHPAEKTLAEHKRWAARFVRPVNPPVWANDRNPDRVLRIGYISPDFRSHAVASFIENILIAHDRSQVRVFAYSTSHTFDTVSARLKSEVDEWRDLSKLNDRSAANVIVDDRIDILVDLAGHTANGRLTLMALRPAPILFTYLGYPATTGVLAVQYRLTDAVADPPGMTESHFTEELVRLPDCFLCYRPHDDAPPPLPRTPAEDAGFITFGSFNGFNKVTNEMMLLWARIMRDVPRSRLLIKSRGLNNPNVKKRILEVFARREIASDRIEIMSWAPPGQRHSIVASADIALDSFPYTGTTTTCETLWLAVPWITRAGETHVSRVSASILTCIGCPELITQSDDEYVEKAIALANDLPRLTSYRNSLRDKMLASPLMNRQRFTRNLESIYREAWQKWCAATPARSPFSG